MASLGRDPMTPFQERLGRVRVQCMTGTEQRRLPALGGTGCRPRAVRSADLPAHDRRAPTGRRRTVPLLYLPHGDDVLAVVASKGGMSTHPAWYLNVLADPEVTVQTGADVRPAVARRRNADERARDLAALLAVYEHFDAYQMRTDRPSPW